MALEFDRTVDAKVKEKHKSGNSVEDSEPGGWEAVGTVGANGDFGKTRFFGAESACGADSTLHSVSGRAEHDGAGIQCPGLTSLLCTTPHSC